MRNPATCRRCRRPLTSPVSIARGYGAWCARLQWADDQAAIRAVFTADQQAKADEANELGALVHEGHGHYRTVGTRGDQYTTSAYGCSCPAIKPCYHMLAARFADLRRRLWVPPALPFEAVRVRRPVLSAF